MSFAPAERTNWSFSLRLALGVGAVFALAGATLYFGVGALLERALAREEVALVLDRREDFRLAWQDGGADGLTAYRRIIAILPALLAPGGVAVLELGIGQADDVAALAVAAGLSADVRDDLAGIPRALILRRG